MFMKEIIDIFPAPEVTRAKEDGMLTLPTTAGYIVEYETDIVSKRTGKRIWHEELYTKDKETAEKCMKELKDKGFNARMYEAIF